VGGGELVVDTFLNISSEKNQSNGVRSRNLGGHTVGPHLKL
jgi:hypothetical protein